ncbi:hypothetical protein R3W88_001214 [Solanum pinnatisectum]|uniref:DUF1985 domain-containing protein n=1 Tax=Solanum pinnatisectum TaxID=50273 RepID=A0AAV9MLC7_9SOLN|nr:hypothetical protein R3W88_001214 [Solanum pinnatisectum]
MDPDPTSNPSSTNRSVYDPDDEKWAENRSKSLHDPLNMRNHMIFLFILQSMKYVIKKVPRHALRFGAPYNTNFLEEFKKSIGVDVVELFRATIFGPYLDIPKCNFQGQITKCLLLLEHANGSILNFGIKEFTLITGLKCKGNTKDFAYLVSTPSRLFQKYFPGAVNSISKNLLVQRFLMGKWENNQDALQMAIMYFVHTFILW